MSNPSLNYNKEVLILGGSGFIGSAIAEHLSSSGYKIRLLSRQNSIDSHLSFPCTLYKWDGLKIPAEAIVGTEAIINLVGQAIADHRWSKTYRERIRTSRIRATEALAKAIANLEHKPAVVIQASAIGYYGLQDLIAACDESTGPAQDFLGQVCQQWEKAAEPIAQQTRLCIMRTGLVLGWTGGALPKLWDIYASGLGSVLGSGRQWMNWIHIADLVHFVEQALGDDKFVGPFNLVAPQNTTNSQFHKKLSEHTRSLAFLQSPAFVLNLVLGARSKLLVKGPRIEPKGLLKQGFAFLFPDIDSALANLLTERLYPKACFLKTKQWVPAKIEQVWEFFTKAENLEKLTPPFLNLQMKKSASKEIELNSVLDYQLTIHGIRCQWSSEIQEWQPQKTFADHQLKGPYKIWHHRHRFKAHAGGTLIEDLVEYSLPIFPFGQIALPLVQKDLQRIFVFRKRNLDEIFKVGK